MAIGKKGTYVGTGSQIAPGITITQASNATLMTMAKTGTGSGNGLRITDAGTGDALSITKSGVGNAISATTTGLFNAATQASITASTGSTTVQTTGAALAVETNAAATTMPAMRFANAGGGAYILGTPDWTTTLWQVANTGVIQPGKYATASAPTGITGGLYYDTTLNKMRVYTGAAWETITSA